MKRFVRAATVLLILVSGSAMAEQSVNFKTTQVNNQSGSLLPACDNQSGFTRHTFGDKSEQLGTPYYNDNTL